jgi:hypothetical protein
MACYAVLVDWHGLWERLAARLGRRGEHRDAGVGPARRAEPAVAWIGAALLLANAACGAFRIDSWPVSIYPRFSRLRTEPQRSSLELRVERSDGSVERIRPPVRFGLGSSLTPEDASAPSARIAALAELLRADGLGLAPGDRLRCYAVTRSILPEDHRRVLGEVLLYEVEGPLPSGIP